jgi:YegS/Rv2252/BmrU family lipid kinase
MRLLLIANPVSGDARKEAKIEAALAYFGKRSDLVDLRYTEFPGHATSIAREAAAKGYDAIIAAGGDGTINEVLNGIVGTKARLGILPWGTGNVFAKEMRFPSRIKKQCKLIRKGKTMRLDCGRCGPKHFLLMASAGFDAYALRRGGRLPMKGKFGVTAYLFAALGAFARYRYPPIDLRLDGEIDDSGTFVLVSNTRLYGSFFIFNQDADPTDGLLDVFVFRESGPWGLLKLVSRLVLRAFLGALPSRRGAGGSAKLPDAYRFLDHGRYRVRRVELRSGSEIAVQADGDVVAGDRTVFDAVPGAVQVILPRKTRKRLKKNRDRRLRAALGLGAVDAGKLADAGRG